MNFIAIVVTTALPLLACTEKAEDTNQTEKAIPIVVTTDGKLNQLQREAQEGDSDAQYNLAYMYENGLGVPKDEAKALDLYQKAAGQGHSAAQTNLDARTQAK